MKSNSELQQDVENAIKWEPSIHGTEIVVKAEDGVITFPGKVNSYSKKLNAENATKRVMGVKAIAEDIAIDYGTSFKKNDTEIATDVLNTWKNNWEVPKDKVQLKVEDGWVNLECDVDWKYQEDASRDSINHLSGVKGVSSFIKIKSPSKDMLEKKEVENALNRYWTINFKDVKVEVSRNKVKLTGLVHSLYQKKEAGRLAWNALGVTFVENELTIIY
jgi:osmotically-inducible protein OsmY